MSGIYISQMRDLLGEFFGWTRKCFILYMSGLQYLNLILNHFACLLKCNQ